MKLKVTTWFNEEVSFKFARLKNDAFPETSGCKTVKPLSTNSNLCKDLKSGTVLKCEVVHFG